MAVIKEIIRGEQDGSISFGNYEIAEKAKVYGFEEGGSRYDIKTHSEVTKLVKNDGFAYESVPGTSVFGFSSDEKAKSFKVEGFKDSQITVDGEPGVNYSIYIDGQLADEETASLGGKISFSVDLEADKAVEVRIVRQA